MLGVGKGIEARLAVEASALLRRRKFSRLVGIGGN